MKLLGSVLIVSGLLGCSIAVLQLDSEPGFFASGRVSSPEPKPPAPKPKPTSSPAPKKADSPEPSQQSLPGSNTAKPSPATPSNQTDSPPKGEGNQSSGLCTGAFGKLLKGLKASPAPGNETARPQTSQPSGGQTQEPINAVGIPESRERPITAVGIPESR